MSSPFHTYAGLVARQPHQVHMCLRNDPNVVGYQFWGHQTVNDAYGNPPLSGVLGAGAVALFQVSRGDGFRSPTLRRRNLGQIPGSIRGQTHAVFDPDDYALPIAGPGPSAVPPDDQWLFIRVQENRLGMGLLNLGGVPADPVLGPIYCVPTAIFFGTRVPTFSLRGTAPSSTASAAGAVPDLSENLASAAPRAMYLVFPRYLTELTLTNTSGVTLLVSFGPEQGMRPVPPNGQVTLTSGMTTTKELVVACPVGVAGAAFTLFASAATER